MGSEQAQHHIYNARQARSIEDKLDHICDALDTLVYAMRELETKVRTLEGRG